MHGSQSLDSVKQVFRAAHPKHAGAADGGIIDIIGAGKRTGMRGSGMCAFWFTPGFHQQNRLATGGRARGRHELARMTHILDIHQDCSGMRITAQIIEQVAEIDVIPLTQ